MSDFWRYILISLCSISLLSSMLFLLSFLLRKNSNKLSLKLIFYIQFCDAIFALGLIFFLVPMDFQSSYYYVPAFIIQFGALASAFTRLTVNILMFWAIKRNDLLNKTNECLCFVVISLLALILSGIPFFINDDGVFSISVGSDGKFEVSGSDIQFLTFYLEIWGSALIILILSIKTSIFLKNYEIKPEVRELRRKLKFYPLVMVLCWFFPFLDRFCQYIGRGQNFLKILHLISISLQGFLNFLVYGWSTLQTKNDRRNNSSQNTIKNGFRSTDSSDIQKEEALI